MNWLERHQVPLYLAGIGLGVLVGLAGPGFAAPAGHAITPALALVLHATFLAIPFARLGEAFNDWRFLVTVVAVNFVVVPVVVLFLSRLVADDRPVLIGVLLVLLAPCIDYVIIFTGLAGGSRERLLAATPALMLLQVLALPLLLRWFVGPSVVTALDPAPFALAFVGLILIPMGVAALVQHLATTRVGRGWIAGFDAAMVPLMVLTLALVVTSQIAAVRAELHALLGPAAIFVSFAVVMVGIGTLIGRRWPDARSGRAVLFAGVTRNSLVVLPLALAMPSGHELTPLVVLTQTLIELLVMVALVRLVPRLIPVRERMGS